jgi:hypothetical protein
MMINVSQVRRTAVATALAVGVVTATAAPAMARSNPTSARHVVAAGIQRFTHNGFAAQGLPVRGAVTVRACDHGVCAKHRFAPDPVCDPNAGVCLGTALRAIHLRNGLTVIAEYA